jgi:hypothetical protein
MDWREDGGMNSHYIPLRIAAADYAGRAMSGPTNDDLVMYGIVSRRLLIAAATPRPQLEDLYEAWALEECRHRSETLALCIAMDELERVMIPEGLLP